MKRKQILWTVILGCSLVCCGLCVRYYDTKEIQSYEEQLEVVNYLNESYQKKLVPLMENKELFEVQLEQLIEEQTQLITEIEETDELYATLKEKVGAVHMSLPSEEALQLLHSDKKYMTTEKVRLYKIPSEIEEFHTGNSLSYYMVKPLGVVSVATTDSAMHENAEDETWVFVSFKQFGEMVNSVGWIKYTQLMEYNAETKELYRGPFILSEDAIDLYTGELAHRGLRGDWVSASFIGDRAQVGTDGGWIFAWVDRKYVLYPEY